MLLMMTATPTTAAGMIGMLVGAMALPAVVSFLTKTKKKRPPARPTNMLQAGAGFRFSCMLNPLRPAHPAAASETILRLGSGRHGGYTASG